MNNKQKALGCLLALFLLLSAAMPGLAAEKKDKEAKEKPPAPVVIEGDELYFSDLTGNIFAKGNVVVTQGPTTMLGPLIRGNTKSNELWIDDKATYSEPGNKLTGSAFHYNYKDHTGSFVKVSGKLGRDLVAGEHVDIIPDGYIIHDGTMTGCPAKIPDYHVSATKVEVWPGDKLIAYNAKFWIKDKVIYTMPRYQKSLRKDAQSEFPQVGYTSKDGAYIKQHLEYPIDDKTYMYFDPAYYTKSGFKPTYGAYHHEGIFAFGVIGGDFRDGNDNWVKKEPEFNLSFGAQIGDLPVDYSVSAVYGKWTDNAKSSWHQYYGLSLTGHPIVLSDTMTLQLGTGFGQTKESYNSQKTNSFSYWALLNKTWSPKFSTYVEYAYTQNNNNSIFDYGKVDVGRALYTGVNYRIDKLNSVAFVGTYDLNKNNFYDLDYYWYHDVHCWTLTLGYRAKRNQHIIEFTTKRF
jgi:lipopolysaccharide assembly outer membrane protein LptD (OstA)